MRILEIHHESHTCYFRCRAVCCAQHWLQVGDDIMALIASVPRTMRTMQWAVQAAISYKRLMAGLDPDLNPEAFTSQLSRLHDMWAQVRSHWLYYVERKQLARKHALRTM